MKKTIQRLSFLLVLALSILVSSCDSWMSGNNFFDTISDEVKYANAPVISVYVRYPNRTMGETSPNGNSKQKVDIPFSVTAVDSTEFKFYKWAAFSSTDSKYSTIRQYSYVYESEEAYEESLGRDELGEEEVVFEDPRSEVTTAKVLHERNDVFIMPICVRRPYIASTNPVNGAVEVVKNQTIDIVFSKPMNPDFLVNADGTLNKTYVSIEAFTQAGEIYIPGGDIENFLPAGKSMQAKLSTSKKTLTISLPVADSQAAEDQIYWPRKSYGITVSYQAEDLLGAQMSTDGYFTFSAGTELDSISPRVMELEVGTNTLKKHTTNMAIPRVGNTLNVRVLMGDKTKESDATFTENNVGKIGYKLEKLQSPTDTLNLSASTILTYDNLEYPYAPGFVASDDVELNSTQSVSGTTFPIIMSSLDEGLWKLTVWGIDKTGNSGKNAANLTSELSTTASQCDIMYIYFIKDTKFPVSSECREGIVAQSDDAPYGWFNATSLSTMKIKETAADAIKDSPNASGICKPFRSPKLWWSFYVGDNPDSWKSSLLSGTGTWLEIPATPTLKPLNDLLGSSINSNSIAEGDVSIYTMFKDDVGNISENYATLNSIKFDRTKPAIGTMEWITPTDVPAGFTSGNVLGNDTLLAIPYTESLSGVKKIAIEVQPPSGAAGIMPCKMAFDDTSFKAYLKNSEGSYVVRSSTKALNANGVQELIFDTPVASSTTSTYMNTLYLENLKIADSMSYLVNGDYTVKVKFYDSALNVSDEKNIIISVDTTAPVVQKVLVEDVKKFTSSAGASATKYFVSSDSYDATNSYFISKVKLDITVKEQTSGLYKITLANAAYVTNNTTVTVTDSSGNVINAPYEKNTSASSRTITFTTPRTVRDTSDTGYVTVKLNNVELSRPDGSKDILVTVEDCAGLNDDNDHKLRFEGDSAEYDEVWGDYSNRSPSVPASFVVKGESAETYPDGYAKTTNLAKATLGLSSFTESGLKKIKLTGAKANHTWGGITDTRVYLGTVTSGAGAVSLAYSIEDGGTTIVLNNPIVSSSAVTLTFTNLELTSTTQGSNTLSAKYEYLTGWESPAKTTTVIYDTVAPVIGSSTESMTWVVKDDASEIPGVSSSATINGQYLVIPVTETNSGVRKIKIEVKKENTEGNMVATTAASCASVAYVGYGTAGTSRVGATTLSSSYWSKSGNELTILDPVNYGKAAYYYIRGIKISDTTSVAEGNYTLHVTLYDYAGNVSGEKTIDMCNDHTAPVVKDSWFDGVVNNASSLSAPRTYTTHSENNTLFIKVEEGGSGIQTIYLHHYFGWDPYNNTLPSCRTIATTSNTKLYKSLDNGATFTEVPCTTGGTSPSYYLKVSNENAIRSTAENDVILKITGLEILATDYADRCAASVSVYMYDFAQNQSSWDTTHNNDKDNPTLAAIAEDRDQADIDQATLTITDSEKVLQGENLVDESGTYAAYTGYTNNPLVNIKFVANEYQHRPSPTSSGIRAFVLEGAKFTEKTVLQWREMKGDYSYGNSSTVNADAHFNSRTLNDQFTAVYNGSKDSIAEVPFAYNTNKFYLVGDNILVVETPISTGTSYNSAPNYFYINYVQLTNTSSDGSKQVKLKIYDTAGTYLKADGTLNEAINTSRPNADSSWPNNHEGSGSITYCATAPTITVNDTAKSDPATITAANIQTLMPTTNGLQAYAEGTTVWTFSHSTQGNRNGSNSTPLGNGVYLYNSYCPYFDLDITPSTAANLLYYKWTNSETVPTSWNTTNSSYKVDVNFPTSGDVSANSVSAKDIYLHVADYAGNVTTKKMSQCQWINETVQDAWPKRKDDTGKKMENGVYYLESDGFYATDIPRLTVTLPAGTSGDVKVYIPTDWFNKVCDNGAPIYGYAMGNHTRYDEGHTDISKAKRDATGPYLEIPQSYITEATAQSTNYAEFYFYVYDAVGQDLTAVVRVTVDSTPPVLELGVLRDSGEYPSGTSSGMKTKWEGSSYVNSTKTRFNVESDGSRYIRQYVDSTQVSTTKGASAANPIVLYVDTNNPEIMLWTNSMDVLKFTCSVDGAEASEIEIDQTTSTSTDLNTNYVRISPTLTETGAMYKFSAVDKGANESSIYIKAYWDHAGPTITATDVQNVNQFEETVNGSLVKTNYYGANATAKVTVTDSQAGLKKVNGTSCTTYSDVETNLYSGMTYNPTSKSLTLSAEDLFDNQSSESLSYNGGTRWIQDTTAPGTPTVNKTSISSDYTDGGNGLKFSTTTPLTITFASTGLTKITIPPTASDNSGGSGIMGYVCVDDTSSVKNFYSKEEVSTSNVVINVNDIGTTTVSRYIYAVDKAGNPSSTPREIKLKRNAGKPTLTFTDKKHIYTNSNKGWFSSDASITVTATGEPDRYQLRRIPTNGTITALVSADLTDNPMTITIPESAAGNGSLAIRLSNGDWSDNIYLESGTTTKSVTTWALDSTAPSGIAVDTVTASGTGGKAYKSSGTLLYYNGSTTGLTITPKATEAATDSGIKGYALSSTGTPAATITLPESGSTIPSSVTIYAFDNVGNYSSQTITLSKDTTAPTVGIVAGSMTGCTEIGGTLYYKDNTAKLQLSVADSGSGVDESTGHLKNNEEISLSGYTGGGKLTISSGKIADNVGNTQAYELISNIVHDNTAPSAPTALTNAYSSDGKAYLSGSDKVFYNASANSIQLTLDRAEDQSGGSGFAGYVINGVNYPYDEGYPTKVTISRSEGSFPNSITIESRDGVGNVSSTGLTVTLVEDAAEPTVTATYSNSDSGTVYKSGDTVYFKGTPTVTLTIRDDTGSGLASGSLQNGATITLNDSYYDATNKCLKINSGMIKDNVGNTKEYTLNMGNLIKDESGPSVESGNFTTGTGITIGTESASSTNPVTWYKSGYYLYIEGCETGGSGLAYWQVGTESTKQTGTYVSSTAEDEDGKITLPTSITTPTVLYIYAEDHLGNSNYCKLSSIDSTYKDKWCYNDATAPAAPAITAVSSVEATVGGTSSTDYAYLDGANGNLYYNGSATALKVIMNSSLPEGVVGYSLSNTAGSATSTTLDASSIPSDAIRIYAFDYKGNVSYRLKLTLVKDEAAPTFTRSNVTFDKDLVEATTANPDDATSVNYVINAFPSGTKVTIPITEEGSGLAYYALVQTTGNEFGYTATIPWTSFIGGDSLTLTLPDTSRYDTNFILMLKDKVGNATQAASSSYEAAALSKPSATNYKWFSSVPLSPSVSAKYRIAEDKKSVEIELSGVKFPISKIQVTENGVGGLQNGKCTLTHSGSNNGGNYTVDGAYSDGTITFSKNYLSFDGKVTFTLTGENIEAPTAIKLNDTYTAGSLAAFSLISGFGRFSRRPIRIVDDDEDIVEGPELVQQPVRNPTFADYFGKGMQPLLQLEGEDAPVAFNVGQNMQAVEESVGEMPVEKAVTIDLEDGYIAEDDAIENQVVQNLAWKAPDGPVLEENEVEGQELALNMASESSASGKMLSARDAGGVQEEKKGWDPALILALVSMLTLGIVALFVRKRTVR